MGIAHTAEDGVHGCKFVLSMLLVTLLTRHQAVMSCLQKPLLMPLESCAWSFAVALALTDSSPPSPFSVMC